MPMRTYIRSFQQHVQKTVGIILCARVKIVIHAAARSILRTRGHSVE